MTCTVVDRRRPRPRLRRCRRRAGRRPSSGRPARRRRRRPRRPRRPADVGSGWERVLAEHAGIVEQHPRRRRLGPGRGRPRRAGRPPDPAGDAHRRHHRRRPQPGPGRRRSSPGRRAAPPTTASPPSRSASRRPSAGDTQPVGELAAHLRVQPRGRGAVRRRAGGRRPAGSGCAATRARAAASPSAVPPSPTGSTARSASIVGDASPRSTARRPEPSRPAVVDAHVHLWDPGPHRLVPVPLGRAAAGHGRRHGHGPPLRRADLPGRVGRVERREARERGRRDRPPLDRRDARARPPGRRRRPPRRHRRRHPADRLGGRGRRAARPADGGLALPGRPPDGRPSTGRSRPTTCSAPCRSGACCSS